MARKKKVIVVGAGHNGLITACYLAKAGHEVQVIERRGVVGGAVCTEEIILGFKFDVGSSAHIMFRSTPIMEELQLVDFGLEYVEMDPWAFYPVPDSEKSITFYRNLERTIESIAAVSEVDAKAYRGFVEHWSELNEGIFEVFMQPPTPGAIAGKILQRNIFHKGSRKAWSNVDTTRQLMSNYGRLINETFQSEEMRAAMAWLAAQSGPAPSELATGDLLGWNAIIHKIGAWRAVGGSGALTQALARCLEHHGGEVILSSPVTSIGKDGEEFVVETDGGNYRADAVTAACHVQSTFLELLDPKLLPSELKHRVENINVGNGFGMIVRYAVEELPQYSGIQANEQGIAECHSAMQLLCPSVEYLKRAHLDFLSGKPACDPAVLAMTFSSIDPSLAPEGKHTLFAWSQYQPYELAEGGAARWDEIADEYARRVYSVVESYAPNMKGKVIGQYVQTPLEIERKLGLKRANVMHIEMSIDQMFSFRPLPELSTYKTPIEGLYLTGASTHPGGGVFGASGRNTAGVMLKDLRKG